MRLSPLPFCVLCLATLLSPLSLFLCQAQHGYQKGEWEFPSGKVSLKHMCIYELVHMHTHTNTMSSTCMYVCTHLEHCIPFFSVRCFVQKLSVVCFYEVFVFSLTGSAACKSRALQSFSTFLRSNFLRNPMRCSTSVYFYSLNNYRPYEY